MCCRVFCFLLLLLLLLFSLLTWSWRSCTSAPRYADSKTDFWPVLMSVTTPTPTPTTAAANLNTNEQRKERALNKSKKKYNYIFQRCFLEHEKVYVERKTNALASRRRWTYLSIADIVQVTWHIRRNLNIKGEKWFKLSLLSRSLSLGSAYMNYYYYLWFGSFVFAVICTCTKWNSVHFALLLFSSSSLRPSARRAQGEPFSTPLSRRREEGGEGGVKTT